MVGKKEVEEWVPKSNTKRCLCGSSSLMDFWVFFLAVAAAAASFHKNRCRKGNRAARLIYTMLCCYFPTRQGAGAAAT